MEIGTLQQEEQNYQEVMNFQPNGEGTGPAIASDLLMTPIPQIMQPGVETAENLAPQRSQTS